MTIPSNGFSWADLGRWFAGALPPEQAESLARWVADDPKRAAMVAKLREAWIAAGAAGEGWDAAAALRRVHQAASEETATTARLEAARPRAMAGTVSRLAGWRRPALRAAAVLAVLAGGALVISRPGGRVLSRTAPVGAGEYRTARGQRLTIQLTDGTQVLLAPGSVLRRPADYGRKKRELELEGEAYFLVTHDATRPFTVHTGRLAVHDLGTRFVVRTYPDETSAQVVVAEGKVAVQRGDETPVVLTRGQLARVDSGHVTVSSNVELESHFAWIEGRLIFRDTPLAEIARELDRWYDVDVRLASPALGTRRVTGVFGNQAIIDELNTIAHALGLTVRQVDGGYELSPVRP